MLPLDKYSFGVGDRFGRQAAAQLAAFQKLSERGVQVSPVWNKSNREHTFIGSDPRSVWAAASTAIANSGWSGNWYVDADHVQLETVDRFVDCSNFFTIDVADYIGRPIDAAVVEDFVRRHAELVGQLEIQGLSRPVEITADEVRRVAKQYLNAVIKAGEIYRHIAGRRSGDDFVTEVSMDETNRPQTPPELLIILAALSDVGVPLQTIAPKFTGRFNKGVDYEGDLQMFEQEFTEDLSVIAHAVAAYNLPANLKLSVHSGSDKFSLYPIIHRVIQQTDSGIHVKTAGTTWLEELIGLAESEGEGLELAKDIYAYALSHSDELCKPYASVIDVDLSALPTETEVRRWNGTRFASAVRHVPAHPYFNASMRQLLHVSFKVAAAKGHRYTDLLAENEAIVARHVTGNIYVRHLEPIFIG